MEEIYNRKKFIQEYQLTQIEYSLLPLDAQIAYGDLLYSEICEECKDKGATRTLKKNKCHNMFRPYFAYRGFELKEMHNGFVVERVSYPWEIVLSDELKEMVKDHVNAVASIKADTLESVLVERQEEQLSTFQNNHAFSSESFDFEKFVQSYNGEMWDYQCSKSINYNAIAAQELALYDGKVRMPNWYPPVYWGVFLQMQEETKTENKHILKKK